MSCAESTRKIGEVDGWPRLQQADQLQLIRRIDAGEGMDLTERVIALLLLLHARSLIPRRTLTWRPPLSGRGPRGAALH
jgi:hypothetical protein